MSAGDTFQIEDTDHRIDFLERSGLDHVAVMGLCGTSVTSVTTLSRRGGPGVPKFSAKNLVNITLRQEYPSTLEDLASVEECLIARCHPVGLILKSRPNSRASPVNYNALRGHMIVFPQDPGSLLDILPSSELRLSEMIEVYWMGKSLPSAVDFRPVLRVRKNKVLAALRFLVLHNELYRDLRINHLLLDS
jgi:hypothetical protein